jgi:hypothetical protein
MSSTPDMTTILTPADFTIMEGAMKVAVPIKGRIALDDGHRGAVGKAVIRLYTAGITDPGRLADAAMAMAAIRLLDRRRWRGDG